MLILTYVKGWFRMNTNSDLVILGYLQNQLQGLERKLTFPKNDWRRREEILAEIRDVKQRIRIFKKQSGHIQRTSPRHRPLAKSDGALVGAASNTTQSGDRKLNLRLEVEYR